MKSSSNLVAFSKNTNFTETKTFYLDIFYTNYVADILQKELRAFQGVVMTQEMHL